MVRERERKRGELKHLSGHQWIRSAIPDSQQPISLLGFLFLKLPAPPCAVLLVFNTLLPLVGPPCPLDSYRGFQPRKNMNYDLFSQSRY